MATDEELSESRRGVEAAVGSMWSDAESAQLAVAKSAGLIASAPMAPLSFFRKIGLLMAEHKAAAEAAPDSSQWNVLVTGNRGVRTSFPLMPLQS